MRRTGNPRDGSIRALAAVMLALLPTACGPRPPLTQPIYGATGEPEHDLDLGRVEVYAGIIRELPVRKRLNLDALLIPSNVFEEIKQSRRAAQQYIRSRQFQGGAGGAGLVPMSVDPTAKQAALRSTTDARTTEVPSEQSEESRATAVAAPYHQILYATADAVLGGRALESLYNVESIPNGYYLFSMPIVLSFEPGRVTREGYIAQADIALSRAKVALNDITIMAVAPAGFTSFSNQASVLAEALGLSLTAAIPYGGLLFDAEARSAMETLQRFEEVARRPEFQVSISSRSGLRIRYLGLQSSVNDGRRVRTAMQPATFNAEILLVAKLADLAQTKEQRCATIVATGTKIQSSTKQQKQACEAAPVSEGRTLLASFGYGGTWSFIPVDPLANHREWDASGYGDSFAGTAAVYKALDPLPRIAKIVEGPGKTVLVQVDGDPRAACFCVEVFDGPSGIGPNLVTNGGYCVQEEEVHRSRSLRLGFPAPPQGQPATSRLEKGALARVAVAPFSTDGGPAVCAGAAGWNVHPVETLAERERSRTDAPSTLVIKAAEGIMETNAIVVRLEIEAPELEGPPEVFVNGGSAGKRDFKVDVEDGTARGVLYVKIPQKVSPEDEHGRTLRIDVRAKSKPAQGQKEGEPLFASTQVLAKW